MDNHNGDACEDWLSQAITRREALWLTAQAYMLGRGDSIMGDASGLLSARCREIEGDAGIFYERLMRLLRAEKMFDNIWKEEIHTLTRKKYGRE
ncbi:MAG: hypothetical protein JNJ94_15175 [Chlorobi bacterium]|nr:hypothetical protein [Chlorobiota bacterium]